MRRQMRLYHGTFYAQSQEEPMLPCNWSVSGVRLGACGWEVLSHFRSREAFVLTARGAAREPNLVSRALGIAGRTLPGQWYDRFGYDPLLAETFTHPEAHAGTCSTGWPGGSPLVWPTRRPVARLPGHGRQEVARLLEPRPSPRPPRGCRADISGRLRPEFPSAGGHVEEPARVHRTVVPDPFAC